ncbi:prepilin-type N-terminal cleavage/methylation domain-containing protein [Chitinivorax tropicus]|uniref:Prepilin-type N-terminal cleavage/methylation domain-containing protein n=1 Tax=Chitinivorax tropicus TaxID=714531 RepID=A0A840MM30_9PROT|nr:prepilin-type N-terminal cleavage/methylation domain-containing protein [Chitinivorax tropicus]MBB5019470.1 prepilin-type N-terminal cleavage/methylation domain-containing protein [Chitinivorax tropicus]
MHTKQHGFTLVELSIVLVVIGLILGLAFKGRDLIDGARVKNAAASVNKFQAAINSYQEKYGALPGDGCTGTEAAVTYTGTTCAAGGVRDGQLTTANELNAALRLLANTNALAEADLKTIWSGYWVLVTGANAAQRRVANTTYLMASATTGGAPANVDVRYICALDRAIDDGKADGGTVRSSSNAYGTLAAPQPNLDCYGLAGTASIAVRLLP